MFSDSATINNETGTCHEIHAWHGVTRGKKNPLYRQVSRRLIQLRTAAWVTQVELGALAGLHNTTLSAVESGEGTSKISTIEQLATALGVSPAFLAFGDDGHLRWKERHQRFGIGAEPFPVPDPAPRPFAGLHRGLAVRLKEARQKKAWSMRELGRKAACTVATISLLEAGTSVVLLSTCEDLAKALEVAPGWLAYGIGDGPSVN